MTIKQNMKLEKAKAAAGKKYGTDQVNVDGFVYHLDVVPTGSLMLDYKTGLGGFPYGTAVEVYGANKLGKSSAIGYPVLGNVQKQGKVPALIASEPRLVTPGDIAWAKRLGFEPDDALIMYPDHAEEAFNMLRDLVFDNLVDYIMIDSLGGLGSRSGAKQDGKEKAYGISGPLTSALNDVMPRVYRHNIGLLLINQQRQTGEWNGHTLYESPGGEGLKHHARLRINIKPGEKKYFATIDGDKVKVGQELVCKFIKNNMAEGQEKSAAFEFFHIATEEYGFGINHADDIVNVGKITGVIKGSGWLEHPTFPALKSGERKINGTPAVGKFLSENPEAYKQIREEVLTIMVRNELSEAAELRKKAAKAKATVEVADGNEG